MSVEEIALADLRENDYNPRKTFDDAAMEDLKQSIEQVGLVQPPTARPLGNGTYEVISGTRRFKALKDLYDEDHEIPTYVRDVDDEQAKWIALAENLDREDLTPIEEAKAYAKYVTIEVDGEQVPYDEYIKGGQATEGRVEVPSEKNDSVKELADRINPGAKEIFRRLELLTLPEDVQAKVVNETLLLTAARVIARLRQIPDPERRDELMQELASTPSYTGSNPDISGLRDRVNALIEDFEEEKQQAEERIEEWEKNKETKEAALRAEVQEAIQWYEDHDSVQGTIDVDVSNGTEGAAEQVIERYQEAINDLGGHRVTDLDDDQSDLRTERDRLKQNLDIVRDENHHRCPFCKAGINVSDLEERIERFEMEIEELGERKRELNNVREDFRERRGDVRDALNEYQSAVEALEREREKLAAA